MSDWKIYGPTSSGCWQIDRDGNKFCGGFATEKEASAWLAGYKSPHDMSNSQSEVKATVAQLCDPMVCGHPKACWKYESCCDGGDTPPNSKIGGQPAHADYNGEGICDFLCNSYCTACTREKATLALFAQRVAKIDVATILLQHETSYGGHPDGAWKWSCKCGSESERNTWDECHNLTREHWAQMVQLDLLALVPDPSALSAHDAALAQKLLNSFTEQTSKLEADNAKLREALDWALGIVQVSPARLNKSQDERYSQARTLLPEPPETQGKPAGEGL